MEEKIDTMYETAEIIEYVNIEEEDL